MWFLLQCFTCKAGSGFKDALLALHSSLGVGALQHLKTDGDVKLYRSELSKQKAPCVVDLSGLCGTLSFLVAAEDIADGVCSLYLQR